jgi:hypothetical protein
MDGLLRHLMTVSSRASAILSRQTIELRGSSVLKNDARYAAVRLVSQEDNSCFHSDSGSDQWLSIDFKSMRVSLTHYTLFMRSDFGAHVHNLRYWVLEGSETGTDVERDRAELNGRGFRSTFSVKQRFVCRFVRLRSIGPYLTCHNLPDALVVAEIELFGTLMKSA